jgi:hypothetical protein
MRHVNSIVLLGDGSEVTVDFLTQSENTGKALMEECLQEATEQGHYQPTDIVDLVWADKSSWRHA